MPGIICVEKKTTHISVLPKTPQSASTVSGSMKARGWMWQPQRNTLESAFVTAQYGQDKSSQLNARYVTNFAVSFRLSISYSINQKNYSYNFHTTLNVECHTLFPASSASAAGAASSPPRERPSRKASSAALTAAGTSPWGQCPASTSYARTLGHAFPSAAARPESPPAST